MSVATGLFVEQPGFQRSLRVPHVAVDHSALLVHWRLDLRRSHVPPLPTLSSLCGLQLLALVACDGRRPLLCGLPKRRRQAAVVQLDSEDLWVRHRSHLDDCTGHRAPLRSAHDHGVQIQVRRDAHKMQRAVDEGMEANLRRVHHSRSVRPSAFVHRLLKHSNLLVLAEAVFSVELPAASREHTQGFALFRMLLMMVVGFACCWLPMNILNLMRDLDMSNILKPNFNLYFMFSHMLAMVGTCLNPLIYCFLNHSFRDEFTTKFLSKLCPRSRKPKRSPSERVEPDRPPVDRPLLDSRRVSLMKSGNEVHLSQEEVERSATTRLTASQSFPKDKPEEQPELS
ncbi:G-PROTEIN-RECEP-F1-2 domain-containing protein [Aphelenchoides fujianensis]|nr:G-PROTEIN-RECEP-F1-2 domain-containing protein [Aphelenchoides fujianensis]